MTTILVIACLVYVVVALAIYFGAEGDANAGERAVAAIFWPLWLWAVIED